MLEVTINGTGNFIQLTAPSINWPEGIDAFEPTVKDNFDKSISPLTGSRIFRFPFVCSVKGLNIIPPIQFNYFDIDSNSYKTISTSLVKLDVIEEQRVNPVESKSKTSMTEVNKTSMQVMKKSDFHNKKFVVKNLAREAMLSIDFYCKLIVSMNPVKSVMM